jgi:hypothetical protein
MRQISWRLTTSRQEAKRFSPFSICYSFGPLVALDEALAPPLQTHCSQAIRDSMAFTRHLMQHRVRFR